MEIIPNISNTVFASIIYLSWCDEFWADVMNDMTTCCIFTQWQLSECCGLVHEHTNRGTVGAVIQSTHNHVIWMSAWRWPWLPYWCAFGQGYWVPRVICGYKYNGYKIMSLSMSILMMVAETLSKTTHSKSIRTQMITRKDLNAQWLNIRWNWMEYRVTVKVSKMNIIIT
jgi:hypothetical protein